jgi:hypothetical protein
VLQVQRKPDPLKHGVGPAQDFIVPEPQRGQSLARQPGITAAIAIRLFVVLAAVQFDDKAPLETDEVHDVRPDRLLSFEFETEEAVAAQVMPQLLFGVGLSGSELFCVLQLP